MPGLTELRAVHARFERDCAGKEALRESVRARIAQSRLQVEKLKAQEAVFRDAAALLLRVAEKAQESVRAHFETMVTHALQYVWGPEHSFVVSWVRSRGSSAVEFRLRKTLYKDGESTYTESDLDRESGGKKDVIAFVLRVAYLQLVGHDGVVVFDEPFSQVDAQQIESVAQLVSSLQRELGMQLVFITHNEQLVSHADKVILVEQAQKDTSRATVLR